jgi:hypothetical protein
MRLVRHYLQPETEAKALNTLPKNLSKMEGSTRRIIRLSTGGCQQNATSLKRLTLFFPHLSVKLAAKIG